MACHKWLYAEAAVAEYWIVNVEAECIEVHTEPIAGRYRRVTKYGAGKTVSPAAFPDITVAVDDLFG